MKLELKIPNLNEKYLEGAEQNPKKAILYALIKMAGGNISEYEYISSKSFEDAIDKMKDTTKSNDYSDLPQLIRDVQKYWEILENIADTLVDIAESEGYIVCEGCGAISKIDQDDNVYYMMCCGNTEQSEIKSIKNEPNVCGRCGGPLIQEKIFNPDGTYSYFPFCKECSIISWGFKKETYEIAKALLHKGYWQYQNMQKPDNNDLAYKDYWEKTQIGGNCDLLRTLKIILKELNLTLE